MFISKLWLSVAGLVVALAFQNCTSGPGTSSSSSKSSPAGLSGNGAGYDGKTYVALPQPGECPNTPTKSEMVVRNSDQKAFVTKENCQPVSPPREVTDKIVSLPPHPVSDSLIVRGFSGLGGGTFSETFDFINITQYTYTVARCAKTISPSQTLTVAVMADANTSGMSGFIGSAFYWNGSQFQAIPTNNNNITITSAPDVKFYSTNPAWNLDLDEFSIDPSDQSHFRATFTYADGGNSVSVPNLDCYWNMQ